MWSYKLIQYLKIHHEKLLFGRIRTKKAHICQTADFVFYVGLAAGDPAFLVFSPADTPFNRPYFIRIMNLIHAILKIILHDRNRSVSLYELRRKISRKHNIWA